MAFFRNRRPVRVATVTLLFQAVAYYGFATREFAPDVTPWRALPADTRSWTMIEEDSLDADVLARLQPDAYVSRVYAARAGSEQASLFIGFFRMREGRGPHSPEACLPGAGWKLVSSSAVPVRVRGRSEPLRANELIAARDSRKDVVLYWYQRGRHTYLSQVAAQFSAVPDLLLHRSTGISLVRVAVVVNGSGVQAARDSAGALAGEIYPFLFDREH